MPNVNDIISVAEALEKSSVFVVEDRCTAVRNRNSTCRRCVSACAADAIEVFGNEIHLDTLACVGCGACVVACPTEAIVATDPTEAELNAKAAATVGKTGGTAVFACARVASKKKADPETYAEVPCVARVGETALLDVVANGAREVLVVDGDCSTCKHRACAQRVDDAIESANALIAGQGSSVHVSRLTGFPEELQVDDASGFHGTTRRGFFSEAVQSAKETAKVAAKTKLENELGVKLDSASIAERLRRTPDGTLPLIHVNKHDTAINALDAIGQPIVEAIDSRLFASLSFDAAKCNVCGMCVVFCPTGALRRNPPKVPGDPLRRLEFTACECIQCGLCADVCWKRALEMSAQVLSAELFDFDPVIFTISGRNA